MVIILIIGEGGKVENKVYFFTWGLLLSGMILIQTIQYSAAADIITIYHYITKPNHCLALCMNLAQSVFSLLSFHVSSWIQNRKSKIETYIFWTRRFMHVCRELIFNKDCRSVEVNQAKLI